MRIALGLEYYGAPFCGWQSQPDGCGVQDALERALSEIAGEPIRVTAAGRTDAGVHATTQVVHFDTRATRPETAWVRGVNALVPRAIAVLWAKVVPEDFHARFSAQERRYRYVLLNHPVRPGLSERRAGWYHAPLDLDAMQAAAGCLIGRHDFSSFRAAECQAKSPVKTLGVADITRRGDYLLFDFAADGFLHHMVRNIVGSLVYVGKGKFAPDWMTTLLEARDRAQAAPTFAPDGLYLSGVGYDARWGIPDRPSGRSEFV